MLTWRWGAASVLATLFAVSGLPGKLWNSYQAPGSFTLAFASPDQTRPDTAMEQGAGEPRDAKGTQEFSAKPLLPDVLLVTIDTLRADHLGAYGYSRPTSPNFDQLAASGVLFEIAYAPMGATSPAHATLFTSRSPLAHGLVRNGFSLSPDQPTLTEALRKGGYQTAGFASAYPVGRKLGFARGFDHFDDDFDEATASFRASDEDTGEDAEWEGESFEGGFDRSAQGTVDAALRWLSAPHSKPVFLWVHLFDPHRPYAPPEHLKNLFTTPGQSRRERNSALYDAEIRGVDTELARLVDAFERRSKEVLLIATADHGEGLGQHGYRSHGHTLYEEELRVPLLVRWPRQIQPRRLRQPARLIDIAPTLLGLLGLAPEVHFDGVDLSPYVTGASEPDSGRPIFLQRPYYETPRTAGARTEAGRGLGVRSGRWKLIEMQAEQRRELYDLVTDPAERNDLSEQESERAESLSGLIDEWRQREEKKSSGRKFEVSPEDREAMRALGYTD